MDQVDVHFKQLLNTAKVGTIACIDNDGWPFQALVPYAVWPQEQCFVIHISSLAKHTRNLLQRPEAALSIFDAFSAGQSVHELPRLGFQVRAQVVERSAALFEQARAVYLMRFPERDFITEFTDFHFFLLSPFRARQVVGFGQAKTISEAQLTRWMAAI